MRDFGCERCWPSSAEAAWEARRELRPSVNLIDESHFHVTIRSCAACGQQFLSVFTERIDWANGDDPQDWTLMPVTEAEVAGLGNAPAESEVGALGPDRRSLRRAWPAGEDASVFWSTGLFIGWHD